VALVDELAHQNVPLSRNAKRYQDVQELLAAGIHVITTLNVQHLESLYDTVERLVGVRVRERIPDTLLAEADQIVNVDLTTEDLRKRLQEGKVYREDKIETALENFFTRDNLEKLRELTLRELAAQLDIRRKEPEPDGGAAMPDQVLVCLSSRGPNSDKLLRYASRFAGRLNKNWYALYVQTVAEDPLRLDPRTQEALALSLTLAKQLGAIVFTYKGEDLARTILRFAREYHVGHIIIGTPRPLPLRQRLLRRRALHEKLIREADGINLVVVDTHPRRGEATTRDAGRGSGKRTGKPRWSRHLNEQTILILDTPARKEDVLSGLAAAAFGADEARLRIMERLQLREQESSTFFNEGAAFPHLRLEEGVEPRVAMAILHGGVSDVPTAIPIRLVFLIVTSLGDSEIQARLLASAARIAANKALTDSLLRAAHPAAALRELTAWEAQDRT
jgi:two-component system sensor histidine kinase KdpD